MQPLGRMMIIIPLRRKMDGNLGMFFAALFIMKGKNRTGLDLFRMAMDETQHGFWFTRDTTPSILPFSSYSVQQRCARSTWTENRKKVINGFELAQAPTAHTRGSHQTFKGEYIEGDLRTKLILRFHFVSCSLLHGANKIYVKFSTLLFEYIFVLPIGWKSIMDMKITDIIKIC